MKIKFTAVIIVFIVAAAACTKKPAVPPPPEPPPAVLSGDEEITYIAGNDPHVLQVHLYNMLDSIRFEDTAVDFINAAMFELGFKLKFVYAPERLQQYEVFLDFVRENIYDNAVFVLPGWDTYRVMSEKLNEEGLLGDFYQTALDYAPDYANSPQAAYANGPGRLYAMPLAFVYDTSGNISALVREDIDAEYGAAINTGSDYEELLRWLKRRDPEKVPGCALINSSSVPLELYLPETGYATFYDYSFFAVTRNADELIPVYSLPEARAAVERFAGLARDGLVKMRGYFGEGNMSSREDRVADYGDYPTVLIEAGVFSRLESYEAKRNKLDAFDASGYRMHILYNGMLPDESGVWKNDFSYYHAVAGQKTDVSEFLRLIQWLGSEENYRRLFYGIEGDDYRLINGRVVPDETDEEYAAARIVLSTYFENPAYKAIPATAPANYESALASYIPSVRLTFNENDVNELADWNEDEENLRSMNAVWNAGSDMTGNIFNEERPGEDQVSDVLDIFFETRAGLEPFAGRYFEQLKKALGNARAE